MPVPCYHPLKRFVTGSTIGKDGRLVDRATFRPAFMCDRLSSDPLRKRELFYLYKAPGSAEYSLGFDSVLPSSINVYPGQLIKCGKCEGCRIDKSREWANRLLLEKEYYPDDQVWFATFTYDEQHVPKSAYGHPETGEAIPVMTLSKRDHQLLLKRIRKNSGDDIRYFGCGEYGPRTMRPHLHYIFFGLRLSDLVPYGQGEAGFMYYQSNWLTSQWSIRKAPTRQGSVTPLSADPDYFCEPLGRVLVAPASWQTFAYVARYTTKKLYGAEAEYYNQFNITPPFLVMSNGIADRWFHDHPDVYDFEYINVATPTGGKKFRPPHRFDVLFDAEDPEGFEKYNQSRKQLLEAAKEVKLAKTSMSYSELLETEERVFRSRIKALRREKL